MRLRLVPILALIGLTVACDDTTDTDGSVGGSTAMGGQGAGTSAGGTTASGGYGTAGSGAVVATGGAGTGGTSAGGAGTGGSGANGVILPDFTMVDINPASPTYSQSRSLSDANGKVLMLYMVQFT